MKNLGIIQDLYAGPLFYKLKQNLDKFNLISDSQFNIARMLREDNLHAAFLSPISYAKDHPHYILIPEVAVSSEGNSNVICLYFRQNLKEIKTIAADLQNSSEMVLAKLVLAEKYSFSPTFVLAENDLENMLKKADAALIVGDYNLQLLQYQNKLDLVDEWSDMMELPYVHGIWATRENNLTSDEVNLIISSANYGAEHLTEISSIYSPKNSNEVIEFLSAFTYKLDENSKNGLIEFVRMAYYYNVIEDLPDFDFLHNNNIDPSKN